MIITMTVEVVAKDEEEARQKIEEFQKMLDSMEVTIEEE